MTWIPDLQAHTGPRYLAIVEAIADGLRGGGLVPGQRLPTQRELASTLGVTVGTVSRAYTAAERRRLVSGEVGRGTFVRGGSKVTAPATQFRVEDKPQGMIDFTVNHPATPPNSSVEREFANTLTEIGRESCAQWLTYQPSRGLEVHRQAGAKWIGKVLEDANAEQVIVTAGAQNAMLATFSALTEPGDVIVAEQYTYSGAMMLAEQLGLRLEPVELDHEGLTPDSLRAACERHRPRALYCIPTIQNPTGATMSLERRSEIAAIAEEFDVAIIEDDVHGVLLNEPMTPIAALAPERTIYLANTSKCLAPGLRIGFVHAPERYMDSIAYAVQGACWMAAPLMAEIASRWILDGTADRILAERAEASATRLELATAVFPEIAQTAAGYHLWLPLPDPWQSSTIRDAAARRGVQLAPTEAFVVGPVEAPPFIRVCLGVEHDIARVEQGLRVLKELLAGAPRRCMPVV